MNLSNFKLRASAAGNFAPNGKKEPLAQTTLSYLKQCLKEQIFGKQDITTKEMKKGTLLEDEAIDKTITWLNLPFILKNEKQYEDEYFTGTPDLIFEDEIIDIKLSWGVQTFPLFDTELPNKDYFYQMQVYMHLTGKRTARLVYLLLETPPELNYNEVQDYSKIDPKYRIKTFTVSYDANVINDLIDKIKIARTFKF